MRKRIVVTAAFSVLVALSSVCAQTTVFFELAKTGTLQNIQAAINQGADINARDKIGGTVLMYAAQCNTNPEVITVLLKAGADPKAHDKNGQTSLMAAAFNNRILR
jgi:ankyrin repeat protein